MVLATWALVRHHRRTFGFVAPATRATARLYVFFGVQVAGALSILALWLGRLEDRAMNPLVVSVFAGVLVGAWALTGRLLTHYLVLAGAFWLAVGLELSPLAPLQHLLLLLPGASLEFAHEGAYSLILGVGMAAMGVWEHLAARRLLRPVPADEAVLA
jgi:hypothetical protein